MKKTILLALCMIPFVAMAGTPVPTKVPVDHIFVPKGFDSNDNTEVVVSGFLPNLCHKTPSTKVQYKGDKIFVTVEALKYDNTNPFCPEMIVPFYESVDLGILDKGNYKIIVNNGTVFERKSSVYIAESTSTAVDDHIYANVEYVQKELGSRFVKLKGYNPSDCMQFDKVEVHSNGVDTYSILPKMKQVSSFCPMKMTPFEIDMEVPADLEAKNVLLHVRSMDGKSINSLFKNVR